jgi:hypothetical protein
VISSRAHNNPPTDLQSFREALSVLQRQVEDLDQLKARHYAEIMEHEEEVWDVVQGKVLHNDLSSWVNTEKHSTSQVCLVVRSTLDVFDRFTSKAYVSILMPSVGADYFFATGNITFAVLIPSSSLCSSLFQTHLIRMGIHILRIKYSAFYLLSLSWPRHLRQDP